MENNEEISPKNYANWFALLKLCQLLKYQTSIQLSSSKFGELLDLSQQSANRRIIDLDELNWIKREVEGKSQRISITKKGLNVMLNIYKNLKSLLESILIIGKVREGMHEGSYYVSIKGYYDQFKNKLGFEPFKGTLNLELSDAGISILREKLDNIAPIIIEGFHNHNREYGQVKCYDVYISRIDNRNLGTKAAILDIKRTHHNVNTIEILAKPYLRKLLNLKNGDKLIIDFNKT